MMLALAISLAGLNPQEFSGLIAKLTPESKQRNAPGDVARPVSPSTRSDSSGFSSLAPSSLGSIEEKSLWPRDSSSRTSSVRSTDGNSVWLTPSSSRAPSVRSNDGSTPSLTPISSRPATPCDENANNEKTMAASLVDVAKLRRDILNLAANTREPGWQVIRPPMSHNDPFSYVGTIIGTYNRSDNCNLKDDYPMRFCEKCGFGQPRPFLARELDEKTVATK